MAENLIHMQHVTKGPAGLSHPGFTAQSDENGIIDIPSNLAGEAKSHGFVTDVVRPAPRVLAKGGMRAEEKQEEKTEDKPAKEDASKAMKGGGK